jgi:hypothetical protein
LGEVIMPAADGESAFPAAPPPEANKVDSSALPPDVIAARLAQDIQGLDLALRQMPRDEAKALAGWMVSVGLLVERTEADLDQEQFAGYLPPAVAVALASGNVDATCAALSELPLSEASRLCERLQQQGLL